MRSKQTDSEMLEELRRKRKSARDRAKLQGITVEEETSDDKLKVWMKRNNMKTCLRCFRFRSETNQAVQSQKMARGLKSLILEVEGLYNLCS